MRTVVGTIGCIFLAASFALGQGDAGMSFLKIAPGGRTTGMGEAAVAVATDAAGAFANPAALSLLHGTDVVLMHREWIQDTRMQYAAVSTRMSDFTLALHLNNVSVDDIEVRTVPGPAISTTSWRDVSVGLSAAYAMSESFSLGISGDFLYEKMYVDDASGYAIGAGALYTFSPEARAGISVNNIGSMNELQTIASDLPLSLRVGGAYDFGFSELESGATIAADVVSYRGSEDLHAHLGGEFRFKETVSLRAGFVTGYESRSITAGLGLALQDFRFDYAVIPFRYDLGTSHTISVGYTFH